MTNAEKIDSIDWLIFEISPKNQLKRLEHKLALEALDISPFERKEYILSELHAMREKLIAISA